MADGFSLAALHVGMKLFRGISVRCRGLFHRWQGVEYPELLFPASVVDSLRTMSWLCRCSPFSPVAEESGFGLQVQSRDAEDTEPRRDRQSYNFSPQAQAA